MRASRFTARIVPRFLLFPALVLPLSATPTEPVGAQSRGETAASDERLSAEELELIDLDRRRGKLRQVLADLDELIEELPGDFALPVLRARARFDACDYDGALEDARRGLAAALEEGSATEVAEAARVLALLLVELGRGSEALDALGRAGGALQPDRDPRDAWARGRALLSVGRREEAWETLRAGAEAPGARTWEALLDQARCQKALRRIREAAGTLVAADRMAAAGNGVEPDVLALLGDVYFEAYGEVDDALSRAHSPAELYREALRLHPEHEGARLGLYGLYRFNWRRSRISPPELLGEVLAARPESIDGWRAAVSSALDDGDLKRAREGLERLGALAPGRRDVRAERAALAWIEHDRDGARELLARLVEEDPGDSRPEREVGRHLIELYRFAEALPFLADAVERDPLDWTAWTLLGRAQANTGDEKSARESLAHATEVADGRRDAWRDNMALVLRRMDESMVDHVEEELSFRWLPDAAPVLERYLVPFYEGAREELSGRYGYTPGPVRIEVFRSWTDFSVRSTGFAGYPALGVCFGPVVTAVSPLSEARGSFSWARTSYHEFTHVVHLGLSHNRCPRWITEGLATWEEGNRDPAWWRNLRREMLDARANDDIIPVRRLNAAFRGERVIFAYYQGGLLCKMLIEEHGFAPMVRLLGAFDRGADLDAALGEVFGRTPEELDEAFAGFVDRELAGLAIEPRWSPEATFRRRFRLARSAPEDAAERAAWQEEWARVAWGSYWAGERVDAEEALRIAGTGGELPARAWLLRGELEIARGEREAALASLRRGFELGGEDFRGRMALGALLVRAGELEEAEVQFLQAEADFPGYDDARFSAELRLAQLYEAQGRTDEAQEARRRWLEFNSGDYEVRMQVAEWLHAEGRLEEAETLYREANEVDPFRRHLHLQWGRALHALGRTEEALREFEVGLLVTPALDGDLLAGAGHAELAPGHEGLIDLALGEEDAGEGGGDLVVDRWTREASLLHGERAQVLVDLERPEEAREAIEAALALDPDCEPALAARARLP